MQQFIGSFLGVAVGALITAAVAYYYYDLAAIDLKKESKKLRGLSQIIIKLLEEGTDNLKVKYNEEGEVVGLNLNIESKPVEMGMKGYPSTVTHGDQTN